MKTGTDTTFNGNRNTMTNIEQGRWGGCKHIFQGKKGLCHDILRLIVGKSKRVDNQGIIAQVKRAFKSYYFFPPKKQ